jgi:hypothetical protein
MYGMYIIRCGAQENHSALLSNFHSGALYFELWQTKRHEMKMTRIIDHIDHQASTTASSTT